MLLFKAHEEFDRLIASEPILQSRKWQLVWKESSTLLGFCSYRTPTIMLNKQLLLHNNEAQLLDTIRHEIAHAYCLYTVGPSHGHKTAWQLQAMRFGAEPKACAQFQLIKKWEFRCTVCNRKWYRQRKPKSQFGIHCNQINSWHLTGTKNANVS